jgi:hypothetical protein
MYVNGDSDLGHPICAGEKAAARARSHGDANLMLATFAVMLSSPRSGGVAERLAAAR